ncbi:MarC family protein [Candidatus Karelsulcia muelleri]|nr:MarC family protein [Candidatus Karelsulcia muelleri]MBS0018842.1 MarC family protein [Candidatus Karelsulcia muelleri]MBU6942259.1 MarC family protein [Candidatus Karelsulcia muelleri]MCJ7422611.1 MarC family protein [Candidatus Karelsulcia muelleri]
MQNIRLLCTCFMVLFSIIDVIGNAPIIIGYKNKGDIINPNQVTLVSLGIFLFFIFLGNFILNTFGIDIYTFSLAGSIILFFISLEMILGIEFYKRDKSTSAQVSIIPISFPLIAGPGSVTTLMSLKKNYDMQTILISLILNMIIVFFVIKKIDYIENNISNDNLNIIKKVFGIILLSYSIKLFGRNICNIFNTESVIKIV